MILVSKMFYIITQSHVVHVFCVANANVHVLFTAVPRDCLLPLVARSHRYLPVRGLILVIQENHIPVP